MRFVAIEYNIPSLVNKPFKGYLRIPDDFPSSWVVGFDAYLRREKKVKGEITYYPLNIRTMTPLGMGKDIPGYDNLEDDFNLAIRSTKYFPSNPDNDAIRRAWSKRDSMSPDYAPKER